MRHFLVLFIFLQQIYPISNLIWRQGVSVEISSPVSGETLRGNVVITGSSIVDGFAAYEVSFAYPSENNGPWFQIVQSSTSITNGVLANWDTTQITDGEYILRLRVFDVNGAVVEVIIPDLQVRNYTATEEPATPTPTETMTPTITPIPPTHTATPRPTATVLPTPTKMPSNPAILPVKDISRVIIYGAGSAGIIFLFLVLYSRIRRK